MAEIRNVEALTASLAKANISGNIAASPRVFSMPKMDNQLFATIIIGYLLPMIHRPEEFSAKACEISEFSKSELAELRAGMIVHEANTDYLKRCFLFQHFIDQCAYAVNDADYFCYMMDVCVTIHAIDAEQSPHIIGNQGAEHHIHIQQRGTQYDLVDIYDDMRSRLSDAIYSLSVNEQLLVAINDKNLCDINHLVRSSNVNAVTDAGYSALMVAAAGDDTALTLKLLALGADPCYAHPVEGTHALLAAETNNANFDIISALVIAMASKERLITVDDDERIPDIIDKLIDAYFSPGVKTSSEYCYGDRARYYLSRLHPEFDSCTDKDLKAFHKRSSDLNLVKNFPKEGFNGDADIKRIRRALFADKSLADESRVASRLLGIRLSPSTNNHVSSPHHEFAVSFNETYHRSTKNPIKTFVGESRLQIQETNMPQGINRNLNGSDKAHIGAYHNVCEALNARGNITPTRRRGDHKPKTVSTFRGLYDAMIKYKRDMCQYIVGQSKTTFCKPGHYRSYPCLMINLDMKKKISEGTAKAWVDFIMSFFVGAVNAYAKLAGIPIECLRRASFGFITPSVAATVSSPKLGVSFRVELGIAPKAYYDVMIKALKMLDKVLIKFHENSKKESIKSQYALPDNHFITSKKYTHYKKTKRPTVNNYLDLCWAKIEKTHKTGIYSAMRTPFARSGVAKKIYSEMLTCASDGDAVKIFTDSLVWSLGLLRLEGSGSASQISCNQTVDVVQFEAITGAYRCDDPGYWEMIEMITNVFGRRFNELPPSHDVTVIAKQTIDELRQEISSKTLSDTVYLIEKANELLFAQTLLQFKGEPVTDFFGSDSDLEATVNNKTLYGRKIIIKNGTRALLAAFEAVYSHLNNKGEVPKAKYIAIDPYYEIPMALKKMEHFESTTDASNAHIAIKDITACITRRKSKIKPVPQKACAHILDTTSAMHIEHYLWLERFAKNNHVKLLFFCSSGFKNEQCGADKNPYGTIRIFTKNFELLEFIIKAIKKNEPPLRSGVSHDYRRMMKSIGAVPTNANIVNKDCSVKEPERDVPGATA